jgi:hypothetical protein
VIATQWVTGPQGPNGDKGDTGSQGPIGPQGETGPQGVAGLQGLKGARAYFLASAFSDFNLISAHSERENSCYLYGMLSEREITRA